MTEIYDWNPMPHKVDIQCPVCGEQALFEFAEIVKISLKKDLPFFKKSALFEYRQFEDFCGHKWHGAVYYANLHGGSTKSIQKLPKGYTAENWSHSKYLTRSHGTDLGAISCRHCHTKRPHILQWPIDAFYLTSIKGMPLWAFNRESAVALRDYIASNERKTNNHHWTGFLLHVPTLFKRKNSRKIIIKKINKLLS